MRKILTIGFFIIINLLLTSCATIISGSKNKVMIQSVPSGANIKIDEKDYGKTPLEVKLKSKKNHILVLELENYKTSETYITSKFNNQALWSLLGFPAITAISFAIDGCTGAMYKIDPQYYIITLEKQKRQNKVQETIVSKGDETIKENTYKISTGLMTDNRDNKVYKTLTIGTQTWLAENLAYKSNKGCWAYKNNDNNIVKYGYLYNFETAKIACPTGWHLPYESEWVLLIDNLGGWKIAGGVLKSNTGWIGSETRNSNGFNALPGGYLDSTFTNINEKGIWWTSSSLNNDFGIGKEIHNGSESIWPFYGNKVNGYSIRCIKD